MSIKRLGFVFSLVFLLAACGKAPAPTATPDIPATAQAAANTMVAGTLTAAPTNTLAPTDTPAPTLAPTVAPTITLDLSSGVTDTPSAPATSTPAAAPTMSLVPGITPTIFLGTTTIGNVNGLDPAYLEIDNLSGQPLVYVTLTCHTAQGGVVTMNLSVTKTLAIQYGICSWSALVQIPNKRYMSLSWVQTNKDKSTLGVFLTKLVIHGP